MNLSNLRDFCGNLLDYNPSNETYEAQLTTLLNDSQSRVLTDRPWSFCQREKNALVQTDYVLASVGVVNGSATVTSTALFAVSSNAVLPGSRFDGATIEIQGASYDIAWVQSANTLYLKTDYGGTTGSFAAVIKFREVYLPPDCATVMNVMDPRTGIPVSQLAISKYQRDEQSLDPNTLGTCSSWMPSEGRRIPAPRDVKGVAVNVIGAGQGARTLTIWMVNVLDPSGPNTSLYRLDVSGGQESAFSRPLTVTLGDTQEISLTPETIPNNSGFYRRYYFTCPALGIKAPVRLRATSSPGANVDTVAPTGGVTITPSTDTTTLATQTFQERSVRYIFSSGMYQSIQLYPHPSATTQFNIRRLISAQPMLEDQDVPLVPEAFSQILAYTVLEGLAVKLDNLPLSAVYKRKALDLFKQMEGRYLQIPSRRLIKGEDASSMNPRLYGPVSWKATP